MTKPVLVCLFQGRFGNQMLQYLFARAWAERNGYELRHGPFIGEEVFALDPVHRPDVLPYVRVNEDELCAIGSPYIEDSDIYLNRTPLEFRGYAMKQSCMLYTKRQAQQWLQIRPELLGKFPAFSARIAFHLRRGDFLGYGYPVIGAAAYLIACCYYGLDESKAVFLSEESPLPRGDLPEHLSFLPDFHVMMHAPTLLRANSTFSWLAGLLSKGLVLSPRVTGLPGGAIHDHVEFFPGNHERLSDHDFVSELHVSP